jgi:ABC-type sulfate/molybdate transport systems ATPase subunit
VALARALVLRPEALLLDKPTADLDPYNVGLIEQNIARLNQEQQTTIVLVTHNLHRRERLAHRVLFLLDGRPVETAATQTFLDVRTTRAPVRFAGRHRCTQSFVLSLSHHKDTMKHRFFLFGLLAFLLRSCQPVQAPAGAQAAARPS